MKFKCIFANQIYGLILEENEENDLHELERILDLWNDVEYLKDFFDNNKQLIINNPYLPDINSIHDFIEQIFDETEKLEMLIEEHSENDTFEEFFNFLNKNVNNENKDLRKARQDILRIYGIKLELENQYIISGGAIKVVKEMKDHPDTQEQLDILNQLKTFIKDNNILDIDSLISYMEE